MFGFFIGFASLVGLIAVLRRGRHCRGSRRSGRGPRFLRHLFERLDTSPGQEKEIRAAVRELFDEAHSLKGEMRHTKVAAGKAFGAEHFDVAPLAEVFATQDKKLARVRTAFESALARVHEALDDEQRAQLASFLHRQWSGRGPMPSWGPYR